MANANPHNRPKALVPDFGAIPQYLRDIPHWVLWRYIWSSEKSTWTKLPVQPSGSAAKSNDSLTWSPFHDVLSTYESQVGRFDGISLALTPEMGIVGVDLDRMVTQEQGRYVLNKWASRIAELLPGYIEISPSGTGLRILVGGTIDRALKQGATEIYNSGRFLTITGCVWESPDTLPNCTESLAYIISRLRPQPPESKPTPAPLNLDANALLQRAFQSQNGWAIQQLYSGDTSAYGGDQSSADLALCGHLAFWSKGDRNLLDQMFRSSSLMRPKWDKSHSGDGRTYGQMTIDKALEGQRGFYGSTPIRPAAARPATPEAPPEQDEITSRVIDISDLAEMGEQIRNSPVNRGIRLDIGSLGDFYRPAPGRLTVITGIPAHGKSLLTSEIVRHAVNDHGWKFALASFETKPLARLLLNLNRSEIGEPSFPSSMHPGMSKADHFAASAKWKGKIFACDVAEEHLNIDGVLAYADNAIVRFGINGFVLDPWSDLHVPQTLRTNYTIFVRDALHKLRRWTQTRGVHTILVAHPTKMLTKEHEIKRPSLYSIADSASFFNAVDHGLIVYRPDMDGTETQVHSEKCKWEESGRAGVCYLDFDPMKGRYSSFVKPLEASKRSYLYGKDNDEAF